MGAGHHTQVLEQMSTRLCTARAAGYNRFDVDPKLALSTLRCD